MALLRDQFGPPPPYTVLWDGTKGGPNGGRYMFTPGAVEPATITPPPLTSGPQPPEPGRKRGKKGIELVFRGSR